MDEDGSLFASDHQEELACARAKMRIWRTKEGRDLHYEKMKNDHLVNTLLWLRQKSMTAAQTKASKAGALLGPSGWRARKHPQWEGLIAELRRRSVRLANIADLIEEAKLPDEFLRNAV